MLVGVIIPVFDERERLAEAIARLDACPLAPPCRRLICIADDGSTDGTAAIVRTLASRPDVRAAFHDGNLGKGAAVRTAVALALDAGADAVVIHDADLEYDPADHAALLAPLIADEADAVIGSRFLGGGAGLRPVQSGANRVITALSNAFTGLRLTDVECGLKAIRAEAIRALTIEEDRFGVEPELVAKLARLVLGSPPRAARIAQVPVGYHGRSHAQGKKIGWKDGVSALRCIARYSLRPRR